jgi:hypothetical protein
MRPWLDHACWDGVATEFRDLRTRGLSRLLTEETVRFAAVKALAAASVDVGGMRYEWPHPALPGSRIDVVIGAHRRRSSSR